MEDQEYRAILEQLVCPDYGVLASLRPYCLPRKKIQDFASFFRWTFGAKWWIFRTKLGLCMLYLRNEVCTTQIYFRIIDFRIHYFRDPVMNPPEFRKTSLTGRFFVDGVDLGLKFAVRNTQIFSEPEKRCKWNPQGYRFLDKSIYHISTWVTYPILLHDFLMYDING